MSDSNATVLLAAQWNRNQNDSLYSISNAFRAMPHETDNYASVNGDRLGVLIAMKTVQIDAACD